MVLPFEEEIISDHLSDSNGSLVILSSGLPLHSLLLLHPSNGSLLLFASPSPKSSILQSLTPNGPYQLLHLPTDFPSEVRPDLRPSLYSSGRPFFITPRVLIADLLTHRIPSNAVNSLLILNAHRLSDTSTEAFIARILKWFPRYQRRM